MSDDRHAEVSRRAYQLWEQGGGEHGRHEEHWHQASLELEGGEGDAPPPHTAQDVAATADEVAGLPRGEVPAADGTVMTEPSQPGETEKPARTRAAAKSSAASKPRKPKAK